MAASWTANKKVFSMNKNTLALKHSTMHLSVRMNFEKWYKLKGAA